MIKKKSGKKVSGKTPKEPQKKPQRKRGHPPLPYYPDRHPEWVRGLASRGSTRPEICTALGISHGTLNAWMKKYPDFLAALQVGRNETVAKLHNSLVKRALGYEFKEQKVVQFPDGTRRVEVTKKEVAADVGAAKILLVNLDPTFKTERTENEVTGKDGMPLLPKTMSDDEIIALIKKKRGSKK